MISFDIGPAHKVGYLSDWAIKWVIFWLLSYQYNFYKWDKYTALNSTWLGSLIYPWNMWQDTYVDKWVIGTKWHCRNQSGISEVPWSCCMRRRRTLNLCRWPSTIPVSVKLWIKLFILIYPTCPISHQVLGRAEWKWFRLGRCLIYNTENLKTWNQWRKSLTYVCNRSEISKVIAFDSLNGIQVVHLK